MSRSDFGELVVGDRVSYPGMGTQEIVEIERDFDYGAHPPERYTWAITTSDGNRMKIDDRDRVLLQKEEEQQ